jgi:hypothetical protein
MSERLRTGGRTRDAGVLVAAGLRVLLLLVVFAPWGTAVAQEDDHERLPNQTLPQPRAACRGPSRPQTLIDAAAALDRDPEELASRLNLADALVDQGCYQEAVTVLEAGQKSHPHSSELSGKLRDVRSMVTEQTYIQGLTQAAESAKLQRNELRCTRLADISACDEALKSKPGDAQLLAARSAATAAARSDEKLAAASEATHAETQSSQTASLTSPRTDGSPPTQSSSRAAAQSSLPTTAPAAAAIATTSSAKSAKATAAPSSTRTAQATTPPAHTRVAAAAATPPKPHDTLVAPKAADAVAQETLAAAGELTPLTPAYSNDAPAGRSN